MLEDIAILTGGQVISEDLGIKLENVKIGDLGSCKKVKIDKENSTIVAGEVKNLISKQDVIKLDLRLMRQHLTTTKKNFKKD